MRRTPLLQPATNWPDWWADTGLVAAIVVLILVLTDISPAIPAAVGFGIQAGAAIRLWSQRGGGDG